jgi:hypothetical protein
MARKGKNAKNTATKQTSDTTKITHGSSKDKSSKSQIKGNRSSAPKKERKLKGGKGSSKNSGDDYQLRQSVEAGGCMYWFSMYNSTPLLLLDLTHFSFSILTQMVLLKLLK